MNELEFQIKYEKAVKTFLRLAKRVGDLTPVFRKFIPEYREIIAQNFEAKGKIMEQARWTPLTKRYLRWKQRNFSGQPLLVLSGKLRAAAINFTTDLPQSVSIEGTGGKSNLKMKVEGDDYFYYVSERQVNPRKYFYTKNNDLPLVAWRILIKLAKEEIEDMTNLEKDQR